MKHGLLYTVGLIVLSMVVFAANPADAQTTSNGPYYATPSWDQKLPASTRFIVLSNWDSAAVLDRETGLVWEKSPSTSDFMWEDALRHCIQLNVGGRMGWRLPTVQELTSLIDTSVSGSIKLPAGHPFVADWSYWSATTAASETCGECAWTMMLSGDTIRLAKEHPSVQPPAWCVRGGQGVDPQ
jgi:hypothetical protein